MFYQNGNKSFQGTKRRAVYHYRAVFLVIASGIFQLKTFRQIVINLYSTQLPFSTNGISHHKINLGP